jgi:hypothetical protein
MAVFIAPSLGKRGLPGVLSAVKHLWHTALLALRWTWMAWCTTWSVYSNCRLGLFLGLVGGRNRITRDINSRVSRSLREREDFTEGVMKRDNRTGSDPDAARVVRCTALVRSGYISRAARTLGQSDLPTVDEKIIDVLRELHPPAQGDPPSIPSTAPIRD